MVSLHIEHATFSIQVQEGKSKSKSKMIVVETNQTQDNLDSVPEHVCSSSVPRHAFSAPYRRKSYIFLDSGHNVRDADRYLAMEYPCH